MLTTKRRLAFSLLEVIATLAVLSLLAGAVVPSTVAYRRKQDVIKTAVILQNLSQGIIGMQATTVNRYPYRISHLGSPIRGSGTNNVNADTTSCSGIAPTSVITYTTAQATGWGASSGPGGPYSDRTIPVTGRQTPLGTISDEMVRTSANNAAGFLPMVIKGVATDDADELNAYIDGDANAADGSNNLNTVQWAAPVSGYVDVKYRVPVINKC